MKKVFGQTVRDIKREVNKKVLKVPGIERKVLDATSNESWGPHGTLLADIAVASRNYHEYQMIMAVIWKRINDTGKNWRHVYKALIVLEYLVANGSERVIDEIREHGHQISTLADFQYVDSNGRDQGSNVRRKSQSLVMLLNDKEQIVEVRQKAAANRDKFCNTNPGSGMYTPGGYGDRYDDDRYNGRDEYGYGRDREGGYKDDDRSSRNGDSYSRDGDHYSRHSEEHYGRDNCREDDHRDKQNGSRTSADREGDHSLDGDGQYSARGLDREFSDQSISGPPSYEEVVGESRSSAQNERDQKTSSASVPKHSSPAVSNDAGPTANIHGPSPPPTKQEFEGFDEFDPRVSAPATSTTVNKNAEMDLLGSLSDSSPSKSSSTMPAKSTGSEADAFAANTGFRVSDVMQQPFDDPFGDSPFKALPSNDNSAAAKPSVDQPAPSFPPSTNQNSGLHQQAEPLPSFGFGDSLSTLTFVPPDSSQFPSHGISNPEEEIDILAGILPPSGPSSVAAAQNPFSAPSEHLQFVTTAYGDFSSQGGPIVATSQVSPHTDMQYNHGNFHNTSGNPTPFSASSSLADAGVYGDFGSQAGPTTSVTLQMSHQMQTGTDWHSNHGHLQQQTGPTASPFSAQSGQPAQSSTNIYGEFGSLARPDAPITSELSSPDAPINSELSSQSQAGAVMQFGQGNFQHQMGPSDSMFSAESQNEQAVQINNGDFGSQAGLTVPVTSQMSPRAPSGMDTPLNLGNFQHQAGPSASPFSPPQSLGGQYMQLNNGDFGSHAGPTTAELSQISQAQAGMNMPFNNGNFQNKNGLSAPPYSAPHTQNGQAMRSDNGAPSPQYVSTPFTNGNFVQPGGSSVGLFSHNMTPQTSNGSARQLNNNNFLQQQVSGPPDVQQAPSANRHMLGNMLPQSERQNSQMNSQQPVSASVGSLALVPQQQSKEKFQTKSTVWSDTLSRGLVDLNISGPKTNPLADIGVDFDSINRKEKRLEKQSATPVTSTITMGKAMGAGSGTGRAGAGTLKPLPNPTVGNMSMGMGGMGMVGNHVPNMGMGGMAMGGGHVSGFGMGGMGMGGGHGSGMGMGGGYGGMNQQPMGMGMGMGMNSGYNNMGMGMNPGMGQGGVSMQQPGNNMGMGMNPGMGQGGVSMQQPGNWYNNPMMGGNGYPQQPYGGGYR